MSAGDRFAMLLAGLGASLGIAGLCPDPKDGVCVLGFDDVVVRMSADGQGRWLFLMSQLGALPAGVPAERVKALLAANLLWAETAGATLALDGGSGQVVLQRQIDLATTANAEFHDALERFVAAVEHWRGRLASALSGATAEALSTGMIVIRA